MNSFAKLTLISTVVAVFMGATWRTEATLVPLGTGDSMSLTDLDLWSGLVPVFDDEGAHTEAEGSEGAATERAPLRNALHVVSLETFYLGAGNAGAANEFRPNWAPPKKRNQATTEDWLLSRQYSGLSSATPPAGPSIPIPEPATSTLVFVGLAAWFFNPLRDTHTG